MYDEYDAPDIGRENYEACREEERQMQEDRYTVAEIKELQEEEDERIAKEEAEYERNADYARDAFAGII